MNQSHFDIKGSDMVRNYGIILLALMMIGCASAKISNSNTTFQTNSGIINPESAIYEVAVKDGVSYQDVVDSLKSISEGMNFVNPANFPIGEHMKLRGIDPQGIKEVRSFCNLSMGTEIMLDHPEFLVFAPCRIAIYEKPDVNHKLKLFIGLDRPTYDLKSINNPTDRAKQSAQQLENALIKLINKASEGDF